MEPFFDSTPINSFRIKEFGMKLDHVQRRNIEICLTSFEQSTPSTSSINAHFFNEGLVTKAVISVYSFRKTFKAEGRGRDPIKAFDHAIKKLNKQLKKWKKERFNQEVCA